MKKVVLIRVIATIMTIVVIAALGYLVWLYDDTRIIEKPIDEVMNGQYAFSVKDNGDNVVFTLYDDYIPKSITTFYFKNGVVDHSKSEKIYKNRREAKIGLIEEEPNIYNRKLNKNIVTGDTDVGIGEKYDGFSQMLIDTYSKAYIRVNE